MSRGNKKKKKKREEKQRRKTKVWQTKRNERCDDQSGLAAFAIPIEWIDFKIRAPFVEQRVQSVQPSYHA